MSAACLAALSRRVLVTTENLEAQKAGSQLFFEG